MATAQSNAYKNEKRKQSKILTREALFINEYVQTKYKHIYNEAASFYNQINKKYSKKPDLRRTTEFRLWKNSVTAAKGQAGTYIPRQKQYSYNRTDYRDIVLTPSTETPKENHHPNTLLTMCLNIPLISTPQRNASKETVIQEEDQPMNPPAVDQISPEIMGKIISELASEETVIQEGDQTAAPFTPQQISSDTQEDNLHMDPSIVDQLSPEIIEKIIRDLQSDPNMKDLMDDVERQINTEEDLVGLEIDLPEPHDPLQEELDELW